MERCNHEQGRSTRYFSPTLFSSHVYNGTLMYTYYDTIITGTINCQHRFCKRQPGVSERAKLQ